MVPTLRYAPGPQRELRGTNDGQQNKALANVKGGSKATSTTTSRAASVASNSPAPAGKATKGKGRKK